MDLGLDGWVAVLIILELGGALGKFKGNKFTFTFWIWDILEETLSKQLDFVRLSGLDNVEVCIGVLVVNVLRPLCLGVWGCGWGTEPWQIPRAGFQKSTITWPPDVGVKGSLRGTADAVVHRNPTELQKDFSKVHTVEGQVRWMD